MMWFNFRVSNAKVTTAFSACGGLQDWRTPHLLFRYQLMNDSVHCLRAGHPADVQSAQRL